MGCFGSLEEEEEEEEEKSRGWHREGKEKEGECRILGARGKGFRVWKRFGMWEKGLRPKMFCFVRDIQFPTKLQWFFVNRSSLIYYVLVFSANPAFPKESSGKSET